MADRWTDKQYQAITADGRSILVAAAAGSGKTAVLTERIVKKITDKDHPVDIDRMVVVTFTKAAAAQMKQRIRTKLEDLAQASPDNERIQAQMTLLNNAHITTIDSFCLDIVRNYFADIDLDPGFRTADDGEIALLENDVMEELLEDCYTKGENTFFELVDAYGTGRDDTKLVELILKIYRFARSNAWEEEWYERCLNLYAAQKTEELDSNAAVDYLMSDICKRLSDYDRVYEELERICQSPMGPDKYLAAVVSDHAQIRRLLAVKEFSRFSGLAEQITFDVLGRCGKEVSEEKKAYVKEKRDAFKDFINKTLKKKYLYADAKKCLADILHSRPYVQTMVALAKEFSNRMRQEKLRRNIIDFNDMEHYALDILVDRADGTIRYTAAAKALKNFYEEILVDEYQDSNLLQEAILSAIAKDGKQAGNMYMVGDVKQSIYKFRLACPELFLEKYNRFQTPDDAADSQAGHAADIKIELQTNFRSRENVLECVNDIFRRLMNPDFCGMKYDDRVRLNAGFSYPQCCGEAVWNNHSYEIVDFGTDRDTEIHIVDLAGEQSEQEEAADNDSMEAEANRIAALITEMMQRKEKLSVVYDQEAADGYRPLRYRDIVVLSRSVAGWADKLVNALMRKGIPAYSDASTGYFSVREIQLVLNYLQVINNPLQDISMAAVLMSYFGGIDAGELAVLRAEKKRITLYERLGQIADDSSIQAELKEKVLRFLIKLDKYREEAELLPVRDLLWHVIYDTGYYDYVGTMPAGSRRQANLDILLERAAVFENTSYRGLFNFLRYVERMIEQDVDLGEASDIGENEDLVRVMTIHKSKGLEFPVVILAGMGKKLNKKDAAAQLVIDQELGIGTDAVYLADRIKSPTLIKAAIARKLLIDSVSEEMRVLYVAMTRAREKLLVTGTVQNAENALNKWKREAQDILNANGMYSYACLSGMNTYFDMMMPAACMEEGASKGRFRIVLDSDRPAENDTAAEDVRDKMKPSYEEQRRSGEDVPQYPYPLDKSRKVKITVSELKQMQHDADYDSEELYAAGIVLRKEDAARADAGEEKEKNAGAGAVPTAAEGLPKEEPVLEEIVPDFIKGNQVKLAGNERGTAYHRIMECLNYNVFSEWEDVMAKTALNTVKEQIAGMLQEEKITQMQQKAVKPRDVLTFCRSKIGKRIFQAAKDNTLRREQPFVFIDSDYDDQQLIQGIIDLSFEEDDGLVIVDYKTDRVAGGKAGEDELRRRYAIQLDYYAKALCQITGKKVKEKIIYSFALGKEISVTD